MANGYRVKVDSIATDGTNLFFSISVNSGATTLPPITPMFPVGTSATVIRAYLQVIADNGASLAKDIADLVGVTLTGA